MAAMRDVIQEKTLDMEVIVNNKTLDNGTNIVQLEQAVGAAIKSFNGALGKTYFSNVWLKTSNISFLWSFIKTCTQYLADSWSQLD